MMNLVQLPGRPARIKIDDQCDHDHQLVLSSKNQLESTEDQREYPVNSQKSLDSAMMMMMMMMMMMIRRPPADLIPDHDVPSYIPVVDPWEIDAGGGQSFLRCLSRLQVEAHLVPAYCGGSIE
jgi:hypothetical protein